MVRGFNPFENYCTMKRIILIIITLISINGMAQTYLYKGNSSYSSDILYSFDGKALYKGRSTYSSDILFSFDGLLPVPVLLLMM